MGGSGSIWVGLKKSIGLRVARLWRTFYLSQYSTKFTLLMIFPATMSIIRYRAETQYGYYVHINAASGEDKQVIPESPLPWYLRRLNALDRVFQWQNGSKIYLPQSAKVTDLKRRVYRNEQHIPEHLVVGCKGRVFQETDNLAAATRVFCKRNPLLVLWVDPYAKEHVKTPNISVDDHPPGVQH